MYQGPPEGSGEVGPGGRRAQQGLPSPLDLTGTFQGSFNQFLKGCAVGLQPTFALLTCMTSHDGLWGLGPVLQ